ncbi:T-complex protein 1 subunit zeta-like [Eurosta solidaginis]|uniref:T-complex protein 1 subunit zeta-like n=1 Tax=Eurosta solidaginis TaxID=178769 RepID=UPI0035308EFC
MPNPISVFIENQNSAGGAFITNEQGLLPTLVTTKCVVEDEGKSTPRYVRYRYLKSMFCFDLSSLQVSLYCIPATADLLKTTALSITLTVPPMARTVEGEYRIRKLVMLSCVFCTINKLNCDMFCAVRVPEEDLKRTMKGCGGAVMTTVNDINSSVLGQCDHFEERQVGGERFTIFQGVVNARPCTLILRGGAEQFLEETELRCMMP